MQSRSNTLFFTNSEFNSDLGHKHCGYPDIFLCVCAYVQEHVNCTFACGCMHVCVCACAHECAYWRHCGDIVAGGRRQEANKQNLKTGEK